MTGDAAVEHLAEAPAELLRRFRDSGFWFGVAIALIWPFAMFGTRIGWRGGEHLPRTGGALLAINHVSFADPIFDVAFVICHGRMPRFLAKAELWSCRWCVRCSAGGGHIPVYRASATRAGDAYREAIAALKRGRGRRVLPGGHLHRRPGRLADAGQERDRPDRAGHRGAGDPGGELGHPGRAAARRRAGPGCGRAGG